MVKHKGFSLVEMLVAMTILSLITVIASQAFALLSQRWDGQIGNFDSVIQTSRTQLIIQDILQSIIPFDVLTDDGQIRIYFEGNINGFVGISQKSLVEPDMSAVVRLSLVQNSELTYDLLYEEWPMGDGLLLSLGTPLVFNAPIPLATNIQAGQFRYFGRKPIAGQQDTELTVNSKQWWDEFNSVQVLSFPEKVYVQWQSDNNLNEMYFQLQSSRVRLNAIPTQVNDEGKRSIDPRFIY